MTIVTQPGYYGGKFRKGGQSYDGPIDEGVALDKMTKDELLAEAARRGVEVDATATKAIILAAITAA